MARSPLHPLSDLNSASVVVRWGPCIVISKKAPPLLLRRENRLLHPVDKENATIHSRFDDGALRTKELNLLPGHRTWDNLAPN